MIVTKVERVTLILSLMAITVVQLKGLALLKNLVGQESVLVPQDIALTASTNAKEDGEEISVKMCEKQLLQKMKIFKSMRMNHGRYSIITFLGAFLVL